MLRCIAQARGGTLMAVVALLPADEGAHEGGDEEKPNAACVMGMTFEDTVHPESSAAVAALLGRGPAALSQPLEVLLVTGDTSAAAKKAALEAGIPMGKVHQGMSPEVSGRRTRGRRQRCLWVVVEANMQEERVACAVLVCDRWELEY